MTMLLGFNLGDQAFLSADTRISKKGNPKRDDVQKIDVLADQGIIIAAAGSRGIAAYIVNTIKKGTIKLPLSKIGFLKNIDSIIDEYIENYISDRGNLPNDILDYGVILLVQSYDGEKIKMDYFKFEFIKNGERVITIEHEAISNGFYIKAGAIGEENPIVINKIPEISVKLLKSWDTGELESHLVVTNEIFKVALQNAQRIGEKKIGGKTVTLQVIIDRGFLRYIPIRGFRSIIHSHKEYQDVSVITNYNPEIGRFFFRDMRSEGMIITNIDYSGDKPALRYDSCPREKGMRDIFLRCFSIDGDFSKTNLEL